MPHPSASSNSSMIPRLFPRRPLAPLLNCTGPSVVQRKSRPTCTLSLAHVSAYKPTPSLPTKDASGSMQTNMDMDLDISINFVAVPTSSAADTKAKGNKFSASSSSQRKSFNEVNMIPFPTSAQTPTPSTTSTSPSSTQLSTPHVLLRSTALPLIVNRALLRMSAAPKPRAQVKQKLESEKRSSTLKGHEPPSPASSPPPPRKRARKGSISTSSHDKSFPSGAGTSRKECFSTDTSDIPPRPSSPTPDSRPGSQFPLSQDETASDRSAYPPPYSASPPPYSSSLSPVLPPAEHSNTSPVIHSPQPLLSPLAVVSPLPISASASMNAPTTSSQPPAPAPIQTPIPTRRPRLPSSEIKLLIALYRTLVVGLEKRKRLEESRSLRAAAAVNGAFLDEMLVDSTSTDALEAYFKAEEDEEVESCPIDELKKKENDELDVQDAVLALRLREFLLNACGVEGQMLDVDFDNELQEQGEPESPFIESGPEKQRMDVDVGLSEATSQVAFPSDPSLLLTPPRFSSPPPLTSKPSSNSEKQSIFPHAHLIAIFTMRSRGRSRHRVKAKTGYLGQSSLRNELQFI